MYPRVGGYDRGVLHPVCWCFMHHNFLSSCSSACNSIIYLSYSCCDLVPVFIVLVYIYDSLVMILFGSGISSVDFALLGLFSQILVLTICGIFLFYIYIFFFCFCFCASHSHKMNIFSACSKNIFFFFF